MVRAGCHQDAVCNHRTVTHDARRHRRRVAWPRLPAIAIAGLVLTATACAGSARPDPRGPDPDVRGDFSGYFVWAIAEPTLALGPVQRSVADELVERAADTIEPDRDERFGISIVATFATPEAADEQAKAVRAGLEDPRMGWGGERGAVGDAVYAIGPMLVVTGLKSETGSDEELGTKPPIHPLAQLLAAADGQVLLEGDRSGEGSIVADVSCRPADPASGTALLDELGDAILTAGQFSTRPPWIGPPLTAEQALTRVTYRRWQHAATVALGDQHFQDLAKRLANPNATAAEHEAVMNELQAYLRQRGIELIEGEIDPAALALILNTGALSDETARQAWARAVGERMGRLPVTSTPHGDEPAPADHARLPILGTIRLNGGRLEMGWVMFGRLAAGLPSLAGYLTERGCDDIRIGLADFDDVRAD